MPVLNANAPAGADAAASVLDVARSLNKAMLGMYGKAITEAGVDYKALGSDPDFAAYVQSTGALRSVDLSGLTDANERKAFLLNIYNALVIHGMVELGVPASPLENKTFFKDTAYDIGGLEISLDGIEHGILRGNQAHPTSGERTWPLDDARAKLAMDVKELDPRIHFALVCGAKSCPPIRIFSPANVDRALDAATANFLESEVTLKDGGVIELSRILFWYGRDFGADDKAMLEWLLPHMPEDLQQQVRALVDGGEFKVEFKEYNWQTNQTTA